MAGTVKIQYSMYLSNGNLLYQPKSESFSPSLAGTNGPTPGAVSISTTGTDISLAQLTTVSGSKGGGWAKLKNLDPTNFVTYGKWDTVAFHPLGELLPGESIPIRLSRSITANNETLRFKADTAPVIVSVEAFDP